MPPAAVVEDAAQSESAGIENGSYVAGKNEKWPREHVSPAPHAHAYSPSTSQLLKTEGELITQTKQRHCYYKTCDWDFHSREWLSSSWLNALEKRLCIKIIILRISNF